MYRHIKSVVKRTLKLIMVISVVLHITPSIANIQTIRSVKLENGILKIKARNTPLKGILEDIQKSTGINIETGKLKEEKLIDADIETSEIKKAILKLLKNTDYKMSIFSPKKGKAVIYEIVLYQSNGKEQKQDNAAPQKEEAAPGQLESLNSVGVVTDLSVFEKRKGNKTLWSNIKESSNIEVVPHHFMVKFSPSLSYEEIEKEISSIAKYSFKLEKTGLTKLNYYKVVFSENENDSEATSLLLKKPGVALLEPDFLIHIDDITPDDPKYSSQWGLAEIGAPSAWEATTGSSAVVIAIIDTGVEYTHPDLAENLWNNGGEIADNGIDDDNNGYIDDTIGYDFVSISDSFVYEDEDGGPEDNDPMDVQGHGTHVAGIAAAKGNNNTGGSGVAWGCSIMSLRAGFKNSSGGGSLLSSDISNAIMYAADNGANIISMSFGGSSASTTQQDALEYAASRGVISVAAAGNSDSDVKHYPAAFDDVISVGSTDSSGGKSSFSNYGTWVDISAPGSGILSTYVGNRYATMSGTSMATPMLAGAVGLLLSQNISLTLAQVRSVLSETSDTVEKDTLGLDPQIGGRVNIGNAVGATPTVPNPPQGEGNVPTLGEWGRIITMFFVCFAFASFRKTSD